MTGAATCRWKTASCRCASRRCASSRISASAWKLSAPLSARENPADLADPSPFPRRQRRAWRSTATRPRAQLKPEAIWEIEGALNQTASDLSTASTERSSLRTPRCNAPSPTFDYVAVPTAQVFPFDVKQPWPTSIAGRQMDTYHRWMEVVVAWTLSGSPVISVPVGFNAEGLPMGMQLIGRPRDDLGVLQLAAAYEQARDWVGSRLPPAIAD